MSSRSSCPPLRSRSRLVQAQHACGRRSRLPGPRREPACRAAQPSRRRLAGCACGLPLLDRAKLEKLIAARFADGGVPLYGSLAGTRPEPLCAIWKASSAAAIEASFAWGNRSFRQALKKPAGQTVGDRHHPVLTNAPRPMSCGCDWPWQKHLQPSDVCSPIEGPAAQRPNQAWRALRLQPSAWMFRFGLPGDVLDTYMHCLPWRVSRAMKARHAPDVAVVEHRHSHSGLRHAMQRGTGTCGKASVGWRRGQKSHLNQRPCVQCWRREWDSNPRKV